MMKLFLLVAVLASAGAPLAAAASPSETPNPDLKVTELDRKLDMTSQLVKETLRMTVVNNGKSAAPSLHYSTDASLADKVTFVEAAVTTSGSSSRTYLRAVSVLISSPAGSAAAAAVKGWRFDLPSAIAAGKTLVVDVEVTLGGAYRMYPTDISQKEAQLVVFAGNHYAFMPYAVASQTTKVTLPGAAESYSKLKPASLSSGGGSGDKVITYGPYADVEPFSTDPMSVHFENNSPFLVVTSMRRTVELSMWGNIAVEEVVDVRHDGARLKGSFSRLDFQREKASFSAINQFRTLLPASARDVYYRDDIGNISTSALRVLDDSVQVDLRPRFPLFGGWKTHYVLGYNVPSYEYLYSDGGNGFVLTMRLLDHLFDDMIVEDFTLEVILPEGCEGVKLETPFPAKRLPDSLLFTYLDTKGRPVISVSNVGRMTEKHIQDFRMAFSFPRASMAREPLILVAAFFAFFAAAIIYVRLDFTIVKDEETETRLKVAGHCEKVAERQERRARLYKAFEGLLVTFKVNKNAADFQAGSKKVVADHKVETGAIADLGGILKVLSPEHHDKVSDLQQLDRAFRDHQTNQSGLTEKLVTGKLSKQAFVDQDAAIAKKKDECADKIEAILSQLRSL